MYENNPIFQSLNMIEERIQEKLTVGALAESIHFSKYHYQRMFREAVGDSVMGYVARRRMSLAAGELAGTDSTVLEIALKYGYDSHEGFTRSFKAYMGVTPTEYRKYHLSTHSQKSRKEKGIMMYSKATDEIIRELNSLIAAAMETAAETRKCAGKMEAKAVGAGKCSLETGEKIPDGKRRNVGAAEELFDGAECNEGAAEDLSNDERNAARSTEELPDGRKCAARSTGEMPDGAECNKNEMGTLVYAQFWEFSAAKAEKIAGRIKEILESVAAIAQRPDEISARFLIIKAVEDAAYEASVTAFQTGLTIARALPEHQKAFQPLRDRYDALARQARIGAEKIAAFFQELSALIFQDMRQNGKKKLESCVEAGRAAAQTLSDPSLPYTYIAEEILRIAEELSATPLEEVTLCLLEDASFRLEAVAFAANVDIWRQPSHRQLFDGISDFRKRLEETLEFFRGLSEDTARAWAESGEPTAAGRTQEKMYRDLAAQESLLLFYLKGEIQKLGDSRLNGEQKLAFGSICGKMEEAINLARQAAHGTGAKGKTAEEAGDEAKETGTETGSRTKETGTETGSRTKETGTETGSDTIETKKLLQEACEGMLLEAGRLGIYGGAIEYIAEEVKGPLKYL